MSKTDFIVKMSTILLFYRLALGLQLGLGRIPERIDHTLCKVQMFARLDKIQEMEDPRATVEAYFNKTGYVCKTYCRIKSFNKELNKIFGIFDSPYYLLCGIERFCGRGGKCKRIGTVFKIDEPVKSVKESQPKTNTTSEAQTHEEEEE